VAKITASPNGLQKAEVRYLVEWNAAFNCYLILDDYTFEEVVTGDKKEDMDVICECLNLIEYDR
jgi:hypothetical protein